MEKEELDREMKKVVDWGQISYHTSEIKRYICKMEREQLNCYPDIRYHLAKIEEIFEIAENKALENLGEEE